jgi:AMP-activated protein kinase-like protein
MKTDGLELLLQDTLKAEVAASAERLIDLEERVVMELGERRPHLRWFQWLAQLMAPTRGARLGQIVIVGATAGIFLVFGLALSDRILPQPGSPQVGRQPALAAADGTHPVLFQLALRDATSVTVVGSFNAWEKTALTDEDGDGTWEVTLPLPPGRYEYAFLVDGSWRGQDPDADEYIQSFGQFSSVRYIGRGGDDA